MKHINEEGTSLVSFFFLFLFMLYLMNIFLNYKSRYDNDCIINGISTLIYITRFPVK